MAQFDEDEDDVRSQFYKEFKQVDTFYESFKATFKKEITTVIEPYTFDVYAPSFEEFLEQFAVAVLSLTHSVLDKDHNYPEYRKVEDLTALQGYYAKASRFSDSSELSEKIHQKTKELLVNIFPDIYELTGNGFRLLDLNLKLYNLEFMANLHR
jgi:hypothetical protein